MEKKRRKTVKRKVENWKWKEGKLQNEERTFFAFHFSKRLKFVLGVPNGNFLPGKSISRREKIRKNDFAPSKFFDMGQKSWCQSGI